MNLQKFVKKASICAMHEEANGSTAICYSLRHLFWDGGSTCHIWVGLQCYVYFQHTCSNCLSMWGIN